MQKLICLLFALCLTINIASAETITKMLKKMNVNKSAVSVSVKSVDDKETIFALNEKTPMTPASTLKLLTSAASLNALGEKYLFTTKLYKSSNNDLYIKLGADPFLTSKDLEKLIDMAKEKNIYEPKNIYIDSTIFDNNEWGEGWQWDDDLNPLMPKFSAYNLDGNLIRIEVSPTRNGTPASIVANPFYPLTFMNYTSTKTADGVNNVNFSRNNSIAPNVINVNGNVSKMQVVNIPNNNPKIYFNLRLEEAIRNRRMEYYKPIQNATLPTKNIYLVGQVTHTLDEGLTEILTNSNNLFAETLFKLAGASYAKGQGTTKNSIELLNKYLSKKDLDIDEIKVVDGSGVSKNNIINADFMTEFLINLHENEFFRNHLAAPGVGTLKNRMLYFKDNLRAKTGTLSDISAIAGYLKTRKGKTVVFDVMINDAKTTSADKKNIEEQILRNIYMNY